MCTNMQMGINSLIETFYLYSSKEGDKYKLSKLELKNLLQAELSYLLEGEPENAAVEKIMNELDENQDGQVNFQEFAILAVTVCVACANFYEYFDKLCLEKEIPEAGEK